MQEASAAVPSGARHVFSLGLSVQDAFKLSIYGEVVPLVLAAFFVVVRMSLLQGIPPEGGMAKG